MTWGHDAEALMDMAIMAGAEDLLERDDYYEILTDPAEFSSVREKLEQENLPMAEAEVVMIPGKYRLRNRRRSRKEFKKNFGPFGRIR